MSRRLGILAAALLILVAGLAYAKCGDGPGDAQAIADARAAVDTTCPCDGFTEHGDYVRCAVGVAKSRVDQQMLPASCKGAVQKCASRSRCGKPGAVTCCRTWASGTTKCSVRARAAKCTAPGGGTACESAFPSCCDACGGSGCTPTTTTTLPPCSGGPFSCGGSCPSGLACQPIDDFPPYCGCVPDGSQACGSAAFPFCNGQCPAGKSCGPSGLFPQAPCICVPTGSTPCGGATQPACNGACEGTDVCQALRVGTFTLCACVSSTATCGCAAGGPCPAEVCAVDGVCGCTAP